MPSVHRFYPRLAVKLGLVFLLALAPNVLFSQVGAAQGTNAGAGPVIPVDLTGEWGNLLHEDFPERIPGPDLGDYLGLPINAAARMGGVTWDASLLTLPEYQCRVHPSDYSPRGPALLRIWKDVNRQTQQTIAYHTHISTWEVERTIWMDGRPHPPEYALHTSQGFSTGKWEGDMLTVTTTHLKRGWIRRNGIPRSSKAVVTEHFIRHGNVLTWVSIVNDPDYLTEPFIRTTDFALNMQQQMAPYPCESVEEVAGRPEGYVPHHLPGTNKFLQEFPKRAGVPEAAAMGGAETMYPEYKAKMAAGK
jgi:hypothetical protein